MAHRTPVEWPTYSLTDVFEVSSGLSKPAADFGSGFPFLSFKDVLDNFVLPDALGNLVQSSATERELCSVRRGDVFLTRTSETQEELGMSSVALCDYEGATFNGFTKRLRPKNPSQVVPEYATYFFRSPRFRRDMAGFASLSTRASLNNEMLSRLHIVLPDIRTQEEIGFTLRALDEKIEQNRRTGRALEALARATFKAWFVDFEPVRAKADGAKGYPGMPPAAFDALPDSLQDLPQGWEFGTLGDYCEINGQSVRPGEIEGDIEYIDIASVTVGRLDDIQPMPFSEAPGRARRRVRHGDTIWSCVRPNRRSYLFIHSPPENRIASTGFVVLSPRALGASYLYELTTRQEFVEYLVANADGSAYPAVRPEHFARADVVVPPTALREAFEEVTMPLRDLLAAGEAESLKLSSLRDYLLPRLISGQVRASRADEHLEEGA